MSETQSNQAPTDAHRSSDQYWCYHCDKRVSTETLADLPDVICCECKNGFVVSIAAVSPSPPPPPPPPRSSSDEIDDPSFGNHFLQVLRLIAQEARDDDAPPPPPSRDPSDDDYLRVEIGGWDNDPFGDDEEGAVVDDNHGGGGRHQHLTDDDDEEDQVDRDEEDRIRRRRDVLRLQLPQAASRRNRILDWAEILMGLEDHSIELRFQAPDSDGYIGNPGDYLDPAAYDSLLENLAESESNAKRGPPPAAKSAIEDLESLVIEVESEALVCAVCKDSVSAGEVVKKLPCGHEYHGECIVPWLGSRNTCPVCRFELPTDDPEYEEYRKKKKAAAGLGSSSSGTSRATGPDYRSLFD